LFLFEPLELTLNVDDHDYDHDYDHDHFDKKCYSADPSFALPWRRFAAWAIMLRGPPRES